ncbi:MAG TPA: cytochrome c oxidase assembly protein [Alphaproteobacteria bacterium]|nr:cytochrome c oxidase assembly protein [Alphaproteobacteria bacterium]
MNPELQRRNLRVLGIFVGVVFGMIGLSFASVPFYRWFCQVTGFGGTTQVAAEAPAQVLDREVTVRLNADVHPDLPWSFRPEVRSVTLKVGQSAIVSYRATNTSKVPLTGTATYNVTPDKAGVHFVKTQCFCFSEQRIEPGQTVELPVYFYVDPSIASDRNADDVDTVTLSYTFFKAKTEALDGGVAKVYENAGAASGARTGLN